MNKKNPSKYQTAGRSTRQNSDKAETEAFMDARKKTEKNIDKVRGSVAAVSTKMENMKSGIGKGFSVDDPNKWKEDFLPYTKSGNRGQSYKNIEDKINANLDGVEGLLVDAFIDGLGVFFNPSIPGKMRNGAASSAKSAAATAAILALASASATRAFDSVMDDFQYSNDPNQNNFNQNIELMKEAGPFPKSRLKQAKVSEAEAIVRAIDALTNFLKQPELTYRTGEASEGGGGRKKTRKRKFKKKKTRRRKYKSKFRGRRRTRKR